MSAAASAARSGWLKLEDVMRASGRDRASAGGQAQLSGSPGLNACCARAASSPKSPSADLYGGNRPAAGKIEATQPRVGATPTPGCYGSAPPAWHGRRASQMDILTE